MTTNKLTTAMVFGCVVLAGACTEAPTEADELAGDEGGEKPAAAPGPGAGPDVMAPPPVVTPLAIDGAYALESTLDVEVQALLPATAYDAMQTLEGLRDRPAQTLFDLAEDAGVPAVGTIRDALPSALESRLYGWMDGYLRGVTTGDGTLAQVIDTVLMVCHADVAAIHLGSELSIAGGTATHRLETVSVDAMDRSLTFDVAPLAGIGAVLEVPVAYATAPDGVANTITLGGHGFELPYGKLAWQAAQALVQERYGRDLRGVLGAQVNCPAMAANIADRCYFSVCVGHETELRAVCEAGLDRAVSELQARVEAATFAPLALDAGTARVLDGETTDRVASMIDAGVWTARLDLGQGLRPAPATFTGSR